MRIAQISTVSSTVRKAGSDSIETLVYLLSRELTRMGHEVTVFAAAGSEVEGELVATLPGPCGKNGSPDTWHVCEWINLCRAIEESGRFDILHSHAYLWSLPLESLSRTPMVHTLHVTPYKDEAVLWSSRREACVTAISKWQWSNFPHLKPAAVIYHGTDASDFTFQAHPQDYFCFLGRFIPGKGPLAAIAWAKALGVRLILAGEANDYYRECIQPHVDGDRIRFAGRVSGAARDRLLGGARALLYPVQAAEPFGLVLVEAMLCGTPVAALELGAVSEIVDQGRTGYYAPTPEQVLSLMPRVLSLDRRQVRMRAEQRFSAERMALEYLEVYRRAARSFSSSHGRNATAG